MNCYQVFAKVEKLVAYREGKDAKKEDVRKRWKVLGEGQEAYRKHAKNLKGLTDKEDYLAKLVELRCTEGTQPKESTCDTRELKESTSTQSCHTPLSPRRLAPLRQRVKQLFSFEKGPQEIQFSSNLKLAKLEKVRKKEAQKYEDEMAKLRDQFTKLSTDTKKLEEINNRNKEILKERETYAMKLVERVKELAREKEALQELSFLKKKKEELEGDLRDMVCLERDYFSLKRRFNDLERDEKYVRDRKNFLEERTERQAKRIRNLEDQLSQKKEADAIVSGQLDKSIAREVELSRRQEALERENARLKEMCDSFSKKLSIVERESKKKTKVIRKKLADNPFAPAHTDIIAAAQVPHYVVIDTCSWMQDLWLIELIAQLDNVAIILPIKVLQELDRNKESSVKTKSQSAQAANRFIEGQLRTDWTGKWRGQKTFETDKTFDTDSSDEEILACCSYFNKQVRGRLCLITNDINMRIQAMSRVSIKAMSATEFVDTEWVKTMKLLGDESRERTPRTVHNSYSVTHVRRHVRAIRR